MQKFQRFIHRFPQILHFKSTLLICENWRNLRMVFFSGRQLPAFLTEQNIPRLDLRDDFLRIKDEAPLNDPIDRHWNVHGNQVAAKFAQPFVETLLLKRGAL